MGLQSIPSLLCPGTSARAAEPLGWRALCPGVPGVPLARAGPRRPSEAVALAGPSGGSMEQPVLLADLLPELGLGQAQAADAALHLLHLHLQQRDDVALLVQLPQQLLRRGARRQRVRVVRGAALHRHLLPRRRRYPPGAGRSSCPGPELHLHRQVDRLHVLGRAPCRGLGGGTGALRGGGGGGGSSSGGSGTRAAGGALRLALVNAAQREDGGDPHQVGLAAALEVLAADAVACGGLEGAEAAADARPGDVLQPEAPQLLVLGERVEVQRLVAVRVVVAARHAAGEARHGGAASPAGRDTPGRPRRRGERARGAPAELQLPQGQPRPLAARQRRPPRPHRNYAAHDAPRQRRRAGTTRPTLRCAPAPPTTAPRGRRGAPPPRQTTPPLQTTPPRQAGPANLPSREALRGDLAISGAVGRRDRYVAMADSGRQDRRRARRSDSLRVLTAAKGRVRAGAVGKEGRGELLSRSAVPRRSPDAVLPLGVRK